MTRGKIRALPAIVALGTVTVTSVGFAQAKKTEIKPRAGSEARQQKRTALSLKYQTLQKTVMTQSKVNGIVQAPNLIWQRSTLTQKQIASLNVQWNASTLLPIPAPYTATTPGCRNLLFTPKDQELTQVVPPIMTPEVAARVKLRPLNPVADQSQPLQSYSSNLYTR